MNMEMGKQIGAEEAEPSQSIDLDTLGDLLDGKGELAGALSASTPLAHQLLDLARYQHAVLAEIQELSDPRNTVPFESMQLIRVKATAALKAAAKAGLLP